MKQKSSLCNADEQLRCIVRKLSIVGNRRFANDIQFNANSWKFNIFESFLNYRILEGCARVYICVKFDSDELWKILKYRKIFRGIWLVFNLVSNFGWNRENSWNYLKVFFVLVLYNKTDYSCTNVWTKENEISEVSLLSFYSSSPSLSLSLVSVSGIVR